MYEKRSSLLICSQPLVLNDWLDKFGETALFAASETQPKRMLPCPFQAICIICNCLPRRKSLVISVMSLVALAFCMNRSTSHFLAF